MPYFILDEVQNLVDWAPQLKHLLDIGRIRALVTGSSGLAIELPDVYRAIGLLSNERLIPRMTKVLGRTAILSGSCSKATQEQVVFMRSRCPSLSLDGRKCVASRDHVVNEATPV